MGCPRRPVPRSWRWSRPPRRGNRADERPEARALRLARRRRARRANLIDALARLALGPATSLRQTLQACRLLMVIICNANLRMLDCSLPRNARRRRMGANRQGEGGAVTPRSGMRERKPGSRSDRPAKHTLETAAKLATSLACGESLEGAARHAGIDPSNAYEWLEACRAGKSRYAALLLAADRCRKPAAGLEAGEPLSPSDRRPAKGDRGGYFP